MTPTTLAHKAGEEYRTLRQIESRLREVLASRSSGEAWLRMATDAFEHLRAHLVKLFAIEESDGCHAAILRERPEKEPEIRRFQAEHRSIMTRADGLMLALRSAGGDPGSADALRTQLGELLTALRQHEATESQLVQRVYSLDVSVSD